MLAMSEVAIEMVESGEYADDDLDSPRLAVLAVGEMKWEKVEIEEYGGRQERAAGARWSCGRVSSEAEPVRAEPSQGKTRLRHGTAAAPSATPRYAQTSAVRSEALVERDSAGSGRCREEQELSDGRGTRRRPSTAELGGNLLG